MEDLDSRDEPKMWGIEEQDAPILIKCPTKVFRTPSAVMSLLSKWESDKVAVASPAERRRWLRKNGCNWNTFRRWLKDKDLWKAKSKDGRASRRRQTHEKQKKGRFVEQQKMLAGKIRAKRARGLKITALWCRITMTKLVHESGDDDDEKFQASTQWFQRFRRRWGFTFQEKTNVKRKSVQQRLPYVRKHHQYLLYTAFREEPLQIN